MALDLDKGTCEVALLTRTESHTEPQNKEAGELWLGCGRSEDSRKGCEAEMCGSVPQTLSPAVFSHL